jgi:hypothetical protein
MRLIFPKFGLPSKKKRIDCFAITARQYSDPFLNKNQAGDHLSSRNNVLAYLLFLIF